MWVRVPPSAPSPCLGRGVFFEKSGIAGSRGIFMDNRPIGFFDSGLGGLTSAAFLKEILPEEHVIYFGDTARTPYGSKSPATIKKFSHQIAEYLVNRGVKMIVIACNTVTAMALSDLRESFPGTHIVGVIEPTARKVASDGMKKVGIIGTKVTVESGVYSDCLKRIDPYIETASLACPLLVPLIEEGVTDGEIIDRTLRYYMDDFVAGNGFDCLIMGCTHYPIISENINRLYPGLKLYNSSIEVINDVRDYLTSNDLLADGSEGEDKLYASDLSENFVSMAKRLFGDRETKFELFKFE
jgi:glutamate racemase